MLYAVCNCKVFSVLAIHYTGYIYSRSVRENYETHRDDRQTELKISTRAKSINIVHIYT